MSCGADTLGTSLANSLTADVPYNTPNVPLNGTKYNVPGDSQLTAAVVKLTDLDLTTGTVDGTGTFDLVAASIATKLKHEYDNNRIIGAEYTKAYIALTEAALGQAASYLLQRDKLYWDNQLTQQQAELVEVQVATSRIKLETAKVEHTIAQLQALNLEGDYAVKKLQMSNLSSQFCISEFKLNSMMPRELALLNSQITGQLISNDTATWNLSTMLPSQHIMVLRQIYGQEVANDTAAWNLTTMLPSQHAMLLAQITGQNTNNEGARFNVDSTLPAQLDLLKEQYEATRAQTLNTRSSGADVYGTLGAQRRLHDQQVKSYIEDTRIKVSKIYSDLWITYITINDELIANESTLPEELKSTRIGQVMTDLREGVELG